MTYEQCEALKVVEEIINLETNRMPGDMVIKLILGILNIKGYDGRSLKIVDKGEGETIPIPQQGPDWVHPIIITDPDPNMPQINPWPPQVWYKNETSTGDFIKDPSITVSVAGNTNCDITSKQLDPEAIHLTDGPCNVSTGHPLYNVPEQIIDGL